MGKRASSLESMSKKKSPNKENSPSVDPIKVNEAKIDEGKVDAVKDESIVPVNEPPAIETSNQPDRNGQEVILPEKSAASVQNDDIISPTELKGPTEKTTSAQPDNTEQVDTSKLKRGFPLLGLLNLVLIVGLMAAAFYYWQMQQQSEAEKKALLLELRTQIDQKADLAQVQAQVQAQFSPLESGIGSSESRIDDLQQEQQALQDSTKKLFDLYGRSKNDWQLSEVAYLLRIAQHKLALENDFEGAALTLQAASDKIATTADPGLLPVRVLISEEIADLKTRARPDLVGMTLLLSQLSQQIQALKPGYQTGIKAISTLTKPTELASVEPANVTIEDKVTSFITSLVTIKRSTTAPTNTEALIVNIEEIMESNLKLTRWTVLERDDFQYRQLMLENVRLFKQYYDLDDAANSDFYDQLLQLQKSVIKPTKPVIDGSLQLLNNIINQRHNAPGANKVSPEAAAPKSVNEAADNV
jgi:uroporphyrin-3 C-methyltransferase